MKDLYCLTVFILNVPFCLTSFLTRPSPHVHPSRPLCFLIQPVRLIRLVLSSPSAAAAARTVEIDPSNSDTYPCSLLYLCLSLPAFFRSIQMKDLLCPPEVHLCSAQGLGAVSSCSEDWFEFWREFVTDTCVWFVLFCFIHQNFSLIHYFEEFPEVPTQLLHYYSIQNILLFQIFCCLWFQIEPCLTFLLPKFPLNSLSLINKTQMTKVTEKGEITNRTVSKQRREEKENILK